MKPALLKIGRAEVFVAFSCRRCVHRHDGERFRECHHPETAARHHRRVTTAKDGEVALWCPLVWVE